MSSKIELCEDYRPDHSSSTVLEKLLEMLAAVLICRVQIIEFLVQIGQLRLAVRALLDETLPDIFGRTGYEPIGFRSDPGHTI